MPNTRKHVIISGMVQGVFFRYETREMALDLGLTGWVKNRYDGRVEAVFEGESSAVEQMVRWCHKGPSLAHIDKVEVISEEYKGEFDRFYVTY